MIEKLDDSNDDSCVDELLYDAIEFVIDKEIAFASLLQRKFKIGYARAGRIIDQIQQRGIMGRYQEKY